VRNPIGERVKGKPFEFVSRSGVTYGFTIENAAEITTAADRALKDRSDVVRRALALRRNLVGDEFAAPRAADARRVHVAGEILSASGFGRDVFAPPPLF
jgi:hypothetical protein